MSEIKTMSPESQGIPSSAISLLIDAYKREKVDLNSIMILRHGVKVAQGWYKPYSSDTTHAMHSFTKSISAMAMGIAAEEGLLSLDDKIISFFPDKTPKDASDYLKEMNVRHLLSMTCGHEAETQSHMGDANADFVECFLNHEVKYRPGTFFAYNTVGSNVIAEILYKITGLQMTEYLKPRLFDPMGITNYSCSKNPRGRERSGGGMFMLTEDMAKLGQLFLNKGVWNGKRLISEEFINEATSVQIVQQESDKGEKEDMFAGYGYQIWMNAIPESYRFDGFYGQLTLVLPKFDMVISMTSATMRVNKLLTTVWRTLLPAVYEHELPENEKEHEALEEKLANLQVEWPEPKDRSPLEKAVNNVDIIFPTNTYSMVPENRVWLLKMAGSPKNNIEKCTFSFGEDEAVLTFIEGAVEESIGIGLSGQMIKGRLDTPGLEANIMTSARWDNENTLRVDWLHYNTANHRTIYFEFDIPAKKAKVTFSEKPNDIDESSDFPYIPAKVFECSLKI